MPDCGWIKLSRKILDWEWYDDPPTKDLFIHLILTANIEPKKWHGITIDRGQVVTSLTALSSKLGHGVTAIRRAIDNLVASQCVTKSSTSKYTVLSVINYDEYQSPDKQKTNEQQTNDNQTTNKKQSNDKQKTNEQQTDNKQTTTTKEYKNKRNKEDIPPYPPQGNDDSENQDQGESLKVQTAGGNARYFTTLDENFALFWEAYPRKASKPQALKAWQKLKPDKDLIDRILQAIEVQKKSDQWQRDNGQYIPYPATWLNNRRWEDDLKISKSSKGTGSNCRSNNEPSYDLSQLFPDN